LSIIYKSHGIALEIVKDHRKGSVIIMKTGKQNRCHDKEKIKKLIQKHALSSRSHILIALRRFENLALLF
jgi:hypothetical protein